MRSNPHLPLVPPRPTTDNDMRNENNTMGVSDRLERTKKVSCWHILSVTVAVFALVVSAFLMVANVTYYLNEDHMLERCTSSDAESFMPCHYLKMVLMVATPSIATAETIRLYLHLTYLAGIVLMTHYVLATMTLMLGVATNKHYALIPWFISQFVLALLLTVCMMLEMYTDHAMTADNLGGRDASGGIGRSKYFVMTTGALAFVIMNWVVNSVTFSRIKKLNGELKQTFDYARFDR